MTLKFKIKPDDIEIPCDDPFQHDLLDRKQTILILTNLLRNAESPFTMSIDASWGNGKTTFLNMWKQHLKKEDFPVVGFSAWDTDFAEYPLIALTSELLNTLRPFDDNGDLGLDAIETTLPRLLKFTLTKAVPWAISLTGGVVSVQTSDPSVALAGNALAAGVAGTMEEVIGDESPSESPEPLTYNEAKEEINSFRNALANTAEKLSGKHHSKPLVIALDELDRCRPSYAVELLEIAKHFFSVKSIVFVLTVDKSQLSHAIKAIYGNDFDAIGYLRRFIDLDFRLPDPDRTKLIAHLMDDTGINKFFESYPGSSWGKSSDTKNLLKAFLSLPALSFRQIQQTLHHLGLVLASLDSPTNISYGAIAVLTILKTIDPVIYQRFVQADITDKEVSEHLFNMPGLQSLESTTNETLFEALLIMGYGEFALMNNKPITTGPSLFHHYFHIIEKLPQFPMHDTTDVDNLSPPLSDREKQILHHMKSLGYMFPQAQKGAPVGFNLTAQRLELFSSDLLGDNS